MSNHLPENYHSITPALVCKPAAEAIDFYQRVFDAAVTMRLDYPDGRIGHAELMIGDSIITIADEHPDMNYFSPATIGNTPVSMHLYVPDVDAVVERAVAAGATLARPVADQFYGDRTGHITDPFGHRWGISTLGKRMTSEELLKVWNDMMQSGKSECEE